jgi:predicted ABC-type exoprotein transport system permease subunit
MEVLLIMLSVVCYLILCFNLSSIEQREFYLRVLSGIVLLILVWVGGGDAPFGPKLFLTFLALSGIWKGYISFKKTKKRQSYKNFAVWLSFTSFKPVGFPA